MKKITCSIDRIILIFSCLLVWSCSQEQIETDSTSVLNDNSPVSYKLSKDIAVNFMKTMQIETLSSSKNLTYKNATASLSKPKNFENLKELTPFNQQFSKNIFRIFQFDEGGYVIVSSSKKQFPILAYSENENFILDENFYENKPLQEWINSQEEIITSLGSESIEIDESTKNEIDSTWIAYSAPPIDEEIIVNGGTEQEVLQPLLSTQWNQGCGYNDLLPTCSSDGSCGHVWTGCVATAVAQVMRYNKYPTTYDWNNMPNNSGSPEIAKLMKDIGNAVNMNYGCDASGAYTSDAASALKNTFGYSNSISYQNFNKNTIYQQLEIWHTPVILSGGTHAWVCDGYKRKKHTSIHNPGTYYEYETYNFSEYYLHMNWGWGPYGGNGWFLYNDFTPGSHNFNSNKKMIIWIKP